MSLDVTKAEAKTQKLEDRKCFAAASKQVTSGVSKTKNSSTAPYNIYVT